ncbi:hypothetical protein HNQ56_003533 [Anaerotaenia torta]
MNSKSYLFRLYKADNNKKESTYKRADGAHTSISGGFAGKMHKHTGRRMMVFKADRVITPRTAS